jgi:hypothetical protein
MSTEQNKQPQAEAGEGVAEYYLVVHRLTGECMFGATWPEACHEHINEAIIYDIDDAKDWKVIPAYTSQTTATQAAVAAAMMKAAKLADQWGDARNPDNGGHALRNFAIELRRMALEPTGVDKGDTE